MNNEQQKEVLSKKELIKPSTTDARLGNEVESLCDGYSCVSFTGSLTYGDAGKETDILF
jgi:hypothetical protein